MNENISEKNFAKTLIDNFFRLRLHIGYIAFPYFLFGFLTNLSYREYSLIQLGLGILIALTYLPGIFAINDYFDAPYDKLDEKKRKRNIFCGDSSSNRIYAYILLFIPSLLAFVSSAILGLPYAIITIFCIIFGFLYSAPPIRLKERPGLDFLVHGLCLGLAHFAIGYMIGYNQFELIFWIIGIFVFVDSAWIQLDSQIVDFAVDKKGGQRTAAQLLGKVNVTYFLKITLVILLICFPLTLLVYNNWIAAGLMLIIPITYLIKTYKKDMESVRHISSLFRKYTVYFFGIGVILISNNWLPVI